MHTDGLSGEMATMHSDGFWKWKLRFGDWTMRKVETRLGWQRNCWGTACFMIETFVYNVTEQNKSQISDQLRTFVCCTTCLLTSPLDDWNKSLLDSNLTDHVVSVQDDGSKSTFYQPFFLAFDKTEAVGFPIGIINVDLSKAFHTCRISGHGLLPTDSRWRPHDWPHQSELNIKDVKVTLFDTAMPCGETSNRVHGSIVIQKSVFVWMESTRSSLEMIWKVRINIPKANAANIPPNHLCVPKVSFTTMVCPAGVVMWSGGCASVVKMIVFDAFKSKRLHQLLPALNVN